MGAFVRAAEVELPSWAGAGGGALRKALHAVVGTGSGGSWKQVSSRELMDAVECSR